MKFFFFFLPSLFKLYLDWRVYYAQNISAPGKYTNAFTMCPFFPLSSHQILMVPDSWSFSHSYKSALTCPLCLKSPFGVAYGSVLLIYR